jgi:MFS family permease
VINEMKVKQPLLPLKLFKIRNVSGGNLTALAVACTLFSMFFFVTLYVQDVLGYGPAKAGLAFLPVTFIIAIASGVVSNLVNKIGYKYFLVTGPIVLGVGLYVLASTMKVGGAYWQNVIPGLALCGLGMGLSFISMTLAATTGVPKHFAGIGSGVLNTSQQVGGSIGLAILSAVYATTFSSRLKAAPVSHSFGQMLISSHKAEIHGFQSALHVGVGLALGAAVIALIVVRNQKVKPSLSSGA